jgi:hypothetical protein
MFAVGSAFSFCPPVHGLRPERREVDDGEPPVSESDAGGRVVPNAFTIGSAMRDRMRHPAQVFNRLIAGQRPEAQKSRYAAHCEILPSG